MIELETQHLLISTLIPLAIFFLSVFLWHNNLIWLVAFVVLFPAFYLFGWCPGLVSTICSGTSALWLFLFYLLPKLLSEWNTRQ